VHLACRYLLPVRSVLYLDVRIGDESVAPDRVGGARHDDATAAYVPSCSTRMTGTLRSMPDFAPRVVMTIIGRPRSRVPSVPPEAS
jgi:hypothetical protein